MATRQTRRRFPWCSKYFESIPYRLNEETLGGQCAVHFHLRKSHQFFPLVLLDMFGLYTGNSHPIYPSFYSNGSVGDIYKIVFHEMGISPFTHCRISWLWDHSLFFGGCSWVPSFQMYETHKKKNSWPYRVYTYIHLFEGIYRIISMGTHNLHFSWF